MSDEVHSHQCSKCPASFQNATSFTSHMRKHFRKEKYKEVNAATLKDSLKKKRELPAGLLPELDAENHPSPENIFLLAAIDSY